MVLELNPSLDWYILLSAPENQFLVFKDFRNTTYKQFWMSKLLPSEQKGMDNMSMLYTTKIYGPLVQKCLKYLHITFSS
jgi:hypothetical protein